MSDQTFLKDRNCRCDICATLFRWKSILQIDSPEKEQVFNEIVEIWETEATDAQYRKEILDGTWPNAEEILERALSKIRSRKIHSPPTT